MAKNNGKASKAKKNATKNNGLVVSSSTNNKKKMYQEISMVCDFFCRYLINSNMFTLEQILNFKTNLRTLLTKKYKQYTWDKRNPLKGNACRSILILKSTLDPILVVAGYKSGFLKMNEEDLNLKSEQDKELISNLNTSISNFSNIITITPPPEYDEDSSEESPKGLSFLENSPSLNATIKANTLEKGKTPITYEVFKNIFLSKGELVLWCDPGSVSYSLDDGQIVILYDKEKEKAEHKKNSSKNKSPSPSIKSAGKISPSSSISPYLSKSESSSTLSKKSPLLLPEAVLSKKDKKKNKKKDRKNSINNSNNENSPSTKSKASPQINRKIAKIQAVGNDTIKNAAFDNSLILPPPYSPELQNVPLPKSRHMSFSSVPPIYANGVLLNPEMTNSNYNFFNSLGREKKISNLEYSPEFTGTNLFNRRSSFLSSIPNNNEMINNGNMMNSFNENYKNTVFFYYESSFTNC